MKKQLIINLQQPNHHIIETLCEPKCYTCINFFSDNIEPKVGSYVLASLSSSSGLRRRIIEKECVARVLEIDGDDYKLSYMVEKKIKTSVITSGPVRKMCTGWKRKKLTKVLNEPSLSQKSNRGHSLFTS